MSRLHGNGIVAEGPDLEKTPRLDQIRIAYENQFVSIFDNAQPGFAAANECFASPDTSLDTVAVQSYPTPPARDNRMLPADKHPWKNLNVSPLALKPAPTRPGIMYDGPPGCSSSHEARDLYVSRYGAMDERKLRNPATRPADNAWKMTEFRDSQIGARRNKDGTEDVTIELVEDQIVRRAQGRLRKYREQQPPRGQGAEAVPIQQVRYGVEKTFYGLDGGPLAIAHAGVRQYGDPGHQQSVQGFSATSRVQMAMARAGVDPEEWEVMAPQPAFVKNLLREGVDRPSQSRPGWDPSQRGGYDQDPDVTMDRTGIMSSTVGGDRGVSQAPVQFRSS